MYLAPNPTIVFIGQDATVHEQIRQTLEGKRYRVLQTRTMEAGLDLVAANQPALVLVEHRIPEIDGLEVLHQIRSRAPETSLILFSDCEDIPTVIKAMKMGAADFLTKPFTAEELGKAVMNVLERELLHYGVQRLGAEPASRPPDYELMFTYSEKMRQVKAILNKVATTDATLLIRGESGVGKGLVATVVHALSRRRQRPLIKVNCATLPLDLLESELFGYEKGAFTGALRRKLGKFEFANRGTIFLDEVGELNPSLQVKLLQVLQDREFSRLGGVEDVRVDVQVIASTNRKLELAVKAGTFRDDLYYRLNVVSVTVPPLRERREEIPVLTDYFLRKYSEEYNRQMTTLSAQTRALFQSYQWPGNIRELENFVKRIVVLESEEFFALELQQQPQDRSTRATSPASGGLKQLAREAAREAEHVAILATLQQTQWNRAETAKLLQISYKTLLYKMQGCDLSSSR